MCSVHRGLSLLERDRQAVLYCSYHVAGPHLKGNINLLFCHKILIVHRHIYDVFPSPWINKG